MFWVLARHQVATGPRLLPTPIPVLATSSHSKLRRFHPNRPLHPSLQSISRFPICRFANALFHFSTFPPFHLSIFDLSIFGLSSLSIPSPPFKPLPTTVSHHCHSDKQRCSAPFLSRLHSRLVFLLEFCPPPASTRREPHH